MKHTTAKEKPAAKLLGILGIEKVRQLARREKLTIGIDLGDQNSRYCVLNKPGIS